MSDPSSSLPAEAPREIPAEAVQAAARAIEKHFESCVSMDHACDATVALEAAAPFLAEHIAAEIERVVASGDHPRPKYERGGFFNDANWSARIAREAFPKETPDAT